ncbi:uncharacterized protein LOC100377452 [Saccoglossus kowalevskii]|uniref:Uncharacterized protein LOC100377452 n=1 Tax=Saccoglossus kowalevskii TaxID=10224 RepID=A0ABM0LUA0_SACKO|nr:PREDICTED: uncharacterized protein LOC100377452 [Saccoglossus kowalevskii]
MYTMSVLRSGHSPCSLIEIRSPQRLMTHLYVVCFILLFTPLIVTAEKSNLVSNQIKCPDEGVYKFFWDEVDEKCMKCPRCNPGTGLNETCGNDEGKFAQCTTCLDGVEFSDSFDYMCEPCTVCSNVQSEQKCTPKKNTECGPCKIGFFKDTFGNCITCITYPEHADCQAWTTNTQAPKITTGKPLHQSTGTPELLQVKVHDEEEDGLEKSKVFGYDAGPLILAAVVLPKVAIILLIILLVGISEWIWRRKKQEQQRKRSASLRSSQTEVFTNTDKPHSSSQKEEIELEEIVYSDTQGSSRLTEAALPNGAIKLEVHENDNKDIKSPVTKKNKRHFSGCSMTTQEEDEDEKYKLIHHDYDEDDDPFEPIAKSNTEYKLEDNEDELKKKEKLWKTFRAKDIGKDKPITDLLGDNNIMFHINGMLTPPIVNSTNTIAYQRELADVVHVPYRNTVNSARDVLDYMKTTSQRYITSLLEALQEIKRHDIFDLLVNWVFEKYSQDEDIDIV